MVAKVKIFEAADRLKLETDVNAFLAGLTIGQLMDVSLHVEGGGSAIHTRFYAWVIYRE